MKKYVLLAVVLGAAAGAVVSYFVGRSIERPVENRVTLLEKAEYPDLTFAAESAVRAVVNIENLRVGRWGNVGKAGGSGVIISDDGYIVTNNHVVENAAALRVKLNDNRLFDARLVGTDPSTDVAVIKIEADSLPTLPWGDSDSLRLGEWVLAIGSPFDLQSTITAGIVSAKGRNLGSGQLDVQSFIQTDAAVNAGNSGGALVNTRGELVGINTALTSPTGTFTGYSFAVPVSIVRKVADDLREFGQVQRAVMGVTFGELNEGDLQVVGVIAGSGAEAAGVLPGDIITAIDGTPTQHSGTLQEYIAKRRPGDKVILSIKRADEVKQIEVELRNMVL
jgi:S1-C subfamily serine protease